MSTAVMDVDRVRVMAYRIAAQQLDRASGPVSELAVLDLGVQDTPYGSARLALAARSAGPFDEGGLALVWAARGAPHLHRPADLPRLVTALWPLGDADAAARIASNQTKEAGTLGMRAFVAAAQAFQEAVTTRMPKGEVSTAVSARVPEEVNYDCRTCAARHISGSLFQQAGLAGGVRLETEGRSTVLVPIEDRPPIPEAAAGTEALVLAYLRLHGPATPRDAAAFLNIKPSEMPRVWPPDLAEVRVGARRAWLPPDRLDALRSAPRPGFVRLLPPSDPLLQARDRDVLVPERAHHREVWRILGNPGVLLADGEITGTWRAAKTGRDGLRITVTPFGGDRAGALPARVRTAIEEEAERVGAARGLPRVAVRFDV